MFKIHLIAFLLPALAFAQPDQQLDPIRATSDIDKQSAPLIQAPGSHEQVGQADLRRRQSQTLKDSLDGVSNLDFTGGPRAQALQPQIRGLDSGRILVLEDGVRQNFQTGHNGRAFGDFSLIENVEVVKGPWSALYGSGAMGGVIAFRRSTADDLVRRFDRELGVQAAIDGASAGAGFGQRLTGFGQFGKFSPLVSYRQSRAHDLRLGDGSRLAYSDANTKDYYSSLGFRPNDKQQITLKLNRFEDEARLPLDPAIAVSPLNQIGRWAIRKEDAVADYALKAERWSFHAKPFWRRTRVTKTRDLDARTDKQEVKTLGADAWANGVWSWTQDLQTILTAGVDYFQDVNDGSRAGGELANFPDGTSEQLGVYLQPTTRFGRFTLTPGARFDSYKLRASSGAGVDNDDTNFSLKFYGDYEFWDDKHLFAGWGQAFNAPRLQDLYISGMHFPGNFFRANPDLKPERADTWEVGTKNRWSVGGEGLISFNATYFRTEARDFIARLVDIPGGTTVFANLDRVSLSGYESAVFYHSVAWGAGLGYGQTRAHNKETGEPLPETAADQWTASLHLYPTEHLTLGARARLVADQDHVPAGTAETPGYFLGDFFVNYADRDWDLGLRVDNAFDRDYRAHTSAFKGTGRDWRVTLARTF
ncbi:MAG TPA: TonB-dependent receptor [Bdellovibrionales bacterium]|nr:TonB-dependent receptor [Bdellovibrionales bacterium]